MTTASAAPVASARYANRSESELGALRPSRIRDFYALCSLPRLPATLVDTMVLQTLRASGVEKFAFANHLSQRRELTAQHIADLLFDLLDDNDHYHDHYPTRGDRHRLSTSRLLAHPHATAACFVAAARAIGTNAGDSVAPAIRARVRHLVGEGPLLRVTAAQDLLRAGATDVQAERMLGSFLTRDAGGRDTILALLPAWSGTSAELATVALALDVTHGK